MTTATLVADKPARAYYCWSPDELKYLTDHYGLMADNVLASRLQRSRDAIVAMAQKIANKPARAYKHWKPDELEYLAENYGIICDKLLAARLQRKESAVISIASRKRVVSRTNNFYTARALAEVLRIPYPRSVILWVKKGWLKGRKSAMSQGKNRLWRFSERSIIECLHQRPWLVVLKPTNYWLISDYPHHFFYIVRKQWQRNPWYTVEQAASLLGLTSPMPVYRYIHRGWLPAERMPCRGAQEGVWIIRRNAIQSFLENDPRPQHKHIAASTARQRFIVLSGEASRLATIWIIKCPSCRQEVKITTSPQLRGPQVRERFIELYVNGNCTHGADCLISEPCRHFPYFTREVHSSKPD